MNDRISRSAQDETRPLYDSFQRQLLEETRRLFRERAMSQATERAFLETPRHLFIRRYRLPNSKEWFEVDEGNLERHLAALYRDGPLVLVGQSGEQVLSTISQPSFVLYMLDMLQLEAGHNAFELGAGSGWNAALMGRLVGPAGHVYSVEIIPELAKMAAETIESLGMRHVDIIHADGGGCYAPGAPYDRAIFTAGSYDLPRAFFEQMKDGGLLLMVMKLEGGGDNVFLLRKKQGHFESVTATPCSFVQMTGAYRYDSQALTSLDALPGWEALREKEVSRTPFWWGGKGLAFMRRTLGIRSFLSITEPLFRVFKTEKTDARPREEQFFGLWDEADDSLVLVKDDLLIAYGNPIAKERLMWNIGRWVDLGMPGGASFGLKVYPAHVPLNAGENQWITQRKESQFLWSL